MWNEIKEILDSKVFRLIYIGLFLFFALFFVSVIPGNIKNHSMSEIQLIPIEGTYSMEEDGQDTYFSDFSQIQCVGWRDLYIRGKLSCNIPKGKEILIYVYQEKIEMTVNQKSIYHSGEDELSRWDHIVSDGFKKGDEITLHMSHDSGEQYQGSFMMTLSRLYQGNRYGLLQKELTENVATILLSILIFVTGLAVVFASLAMIIMRISMIQGYFYCGMLMIAGGGCCFIDYDYITLLFPYPALVNVLDYSLQIAIALFLILYLKSFMNHTFCRKLINGVFYLWALFMCGNFSLYSFHIESIVNINGVVVLSALGVIVFILMLLCVDYYRYDNRQAREVLFSSSLLIICTTIEMLHYYMTHIWWINLFLMGVAAFTLFQLGVLLRHTRSNMRKVEQAKETENALLNSRINQMSHQIRPHFVYNVMTTISCLCETNPLVARDMADEFSDYLRVNVDSMNYTEPIPFKQEIKNMNTYYALEKIRFENKMEITWLLEEDDFEIPALTIEPLVENAIKHGVNYKEDILHITVSTRKLKDCIEVAVEDDGPGFDLHEKKNDGREHVGLINIRKRLELMSHATMLIESEPGHGTKVTIRIPRTKRRSYSEDTGNRR